MKTCTRFVFLFGLIISSLTFCAAQELSKRKCDEYSRKNEALPESNEYRKYMNKFIIAKTIFKEYDAVLISENYALTSLPASSGLQFTSIIVNNQSVEVLEQKQRDDIYLLKLRYNIELYDKMVCLWNREDLPVNNDVFTVVHEAGLQGIPFLRTYVPHISCPIVQPDSLRNRDNFCLNYENGRESETVFENPTASALVFMKSFNNTAGLNKNHYIVGVVKQDDSIYGRKLWPNLMWIESIVWKGSIADPLPLEPECGTVVVANSNQALLSFSEPTYRGEFPWQAALFEVKQDRSGRKEEYLCGGSLLNRDTILTAAHCVTNSAGEINQPARYLVKLGLYKLDGTESMVQVISVYKFIKHELYNVSAYDSDVAIIKLNSFVTYSNYVRPICLIGNTLLFHKQEGTVAGWGRDENNEIPNDQRKGTLSIPSRNDCRHKAGDYIKELLTEGNYCAANIDGQNVCKGDSGSGMVTELDNRWYVRGIVSFGGVINGLCNPREFSLFTNATYFYDWILPKMGPMDQNG